MMKKRSIISRLNKVDYAIFIICSILAIAMFGLFYRDINSFTIKQNEDPIATISFKQNFVQRKFDNRNIWEKVSLACSIYDGDILRTANDSSVKAEFLNDDVKINLNENSMIQIFQNKKKEAINFIGGEIQIQNDAPEKPVVIIAGEKSISLKKNSAVIITAVEPVTSLDEPIQSAIIQVESGEIEITEIETDEKAESEKEEKITVSAGDILELELIEEHKLSEEKQSATTSEQIVSENTIPVEAVIPEIEDGETGIKSLRKIIFLENYWDLQNNKMNYTYTIPLSDLIKTDSRIEKGSLLEIEMSGIPNKNIPSLDIQIPTGEKEWKLAHHYKTINFGNNQGIKANEKFKKNILLTVTEPIVNTKETYIALSYDPNPELDERILISDFDISIKVSTKDTETKQIEGKNKEIESFDEMKWRETSYWNEETNETFYNHRYTFDLSEYFGNNKKILAGQKIRISLSGIPSKNIDWMTIELSQVLNDNWENCLDSGNGVPNLLQEEIKTGKKFSTSQTYTVTKTFVSTDIGELSLVYDEQDRRKSGIEDLVVENAEFSIEIFE